MRENSAWILSGIGNSSSSTCQQIEAGSHIMKNIKMLATVLFAGLVLQQPIMSQTSGEGPILHRAGSASGTESDALVSNVLQLSTAPANTAAPAAPTTAAVPAVASDTGPVTIAPSTVAASNEPVAVVPAENTAANSAPAAPAATTTAAVPAVASGTGPVTIVTITVAASNEPVSVVPAENTAANSAPAAPAATTTAAVPAVAGGTGPVTIAPGTVTASNKPVAVVPAENTAANSLPARDGVWSTSQSPRPQRTHWSRLDWLDQFAGVRRRQRRSPLLKPARTRPPPAPPPNCRLHFRMSRSPRPSKPWRGWRASIICWTRKSPTASRTQPEKSRPNRRCPFVGNKSPPGRRSRRCWTTTGLQMVENPKTGISKITLKEPTAAADDHPGHPVEIRQQSPTWWTPSQACWSTRISQQSRGRPRTSQLVVVATEQEQADVDTLLNRLDTPTRQVLIETKLVELSSNPSTTKGVDWSGTLQAQNVSFGNGVLVRHIHDNDSRHARDALPAVTTPSGAVIDSSHHHHAGFEHHHHVEQPDSEFTLQRRFGGQHRQRIDPDIGFLTRRRCQGRPFVPESILRGAGRFHARACHLGQ